MPHCNELQHTAIHCNTLQHTATHCIPIRHTLDIDATVNASSLSSSHTQIIHVTPISMSHHIRMSRVTHIPKSHALNTDTSIICRFTYIFYPDLSECISLGVHRRNMHSSHIEYVELHRDTHSIHI